jgi:hypothetical protein
MAGSKILGIVSDTYVVLLYIHTSIQNTWDSFRHICGVVVHTYMNSKYLG